MSHDRHTLELLAPAKNADFGIEAILHGADAVYIGGPAFGARANAGNSIEDIARLVEFAHRYRARVFVTLNTLLHDDEIEAARRVAWQVYEAGADALIVQDMGLLELELPPIQLHASTQTDIRDAAKARFLQDVGFSQIVLAREIVPLLMVVGPSLIAPNVLLSEILLTFLPEILIKSSLKVIEILVGDLVSIALLFGFEETKAV